MKNSTTEKAKSTETESTTLSMHTSKKTKAALEVLSGRKRRSVSQIMNLMIEGALDNKNFIENL